MALVNDEPPQLGSLYREDEMWDAYDGEDQDLRRARWLAITAGWVLGQDDMVTKLLAPLTLAELIDLDASLTGLRHEVRHVIAKTSAPWTKNTRPELGPDPA
jgi:hypothetical protein